MSPTRSVDQRTEVHKTLNYFTMALLFDDYRALHLPSKLWSCCS
ncbi:unnamed protein product [Callosobruchus maculatus]|uniref:Uncharacterized protein n=1 Tax=Callosobruchus maculatus TaxID=64391 RepID=A0A653CUJ3_CALMS|nr:unnamed protein product [Callosobruchus maculatus]